MRTALTTLTLTATLAATACTTPQPADISYPITQRTACNETVQPPNPGACVEWINHNPAWQLPANTPWRGPYMDYLYDLSHNNGAELTP